MAAAGLALGAAGCVERKLVLKTDPPGAAVYVDGVPVGESPVELPFSHYGGKRIVFRLTGHATVTDAVVLRTPWYQIFPIDFVADVLIPWTIHDLHEPPAWTLAPFAMPDGSVEALIERADAARGSLAAGEPAEDGTTPPTDEPPDGQ